MVCGRHRPACRSAIAVIFTCTSGVNGCRRAHGFRGTAPLAKAQLFIQLIGALYQTFLELQRLSEVIDQQPGTRLNDFGVDWLPRYAYLHGNIRWHISGSTMLERPAAAYAEG
jgi:hypothetical protein